MSRDLSINEKLKMDQDAKELIKNSIEKFTIDFYKNVGSKNLGNLVTSALSAHFVLAMTAYGAKKKTAKEMRNALYLPKTKDDSLALLGFGNLLYELNSIDEVVLNIANKIFVSDKAAIKEKFIRITESFHSKCQALDFCKPDKAVITINSWCADKTNGKIKDIVKVVNIGPLDVMVVLNAIYFKGHWKFTFDAIDTKKRIFRLDKQNKIRVPTMNINKWFDYNRLEELQAQTIRIPYTNKRVAMIIVVPDRIDGLASLENNLNEVYSDSRRYTRQREVDLYLPKFKIESMIDLQKPLEEMGMGQMFSDIANFEGISTDVPPPFKVSAVLQKAFIEVNEKSSESGVISYVRLIGGGGGPASPPPPPVVLKVDRPFLYMIMYDDITLFTGRVVDPSTT